MKRLSIILACLALVSCLKDEKIVSGGDVPIGFTPMTGNVATKAPIYGEQNATYSKKSGSNYEQFKAFAKFTATASDNAQTSGTEFFPADGVTCIHGGSGTNDYWAPSPTYYWPKNGYLSFHAFSPSNLDPFIGTVTHDWEKGFTITSFQAGIPIEQYRNKMVDLLYSDFVFKKRRSDYTPETGVPYDDDDNSAYKHQGVNITFHHALAGVQFRFKTDADYSAGNVKYTFQTTKIELLNMNYKGEFHENRTDAGDNTYRDAPPSGAITFNANNSPTATPYWIPEADEFSSIFASNTTTTINNTVQPVGSMMLIMPQNLTHATTGNDVKVKVTYNFSYQVTGESKHEYNGKTFEVSLAGMHGSIGGTDFTINQWLINHKYTYTIVFHLDPLIFDPYISADWVDVSSMDINLPHVE